MPINKNFNKKFIKDFETITPILPANVRYKKYTDLDGDFFIDALGKDAYKRVLTHLNSDNTKLDKIDYLFLILASEIIGEEDSCFLNDYYAYISYYNIFDDFCYCTIIDSLIKLNKYNDLSVFAGDAFERGILDTNEILGLFKIFNLEGQYENVVNMSKYIEIDIDNSNFSSLVNELLESASRLNLDYLVNQTIKEAMYDSKLDSKGLKKIIEIFNRSKNKYEILKNIYDISKNYNNISDYSYAQCIYLLYTLNSNILPRQIIDDINKIKPSAISETMKIFIKNNEYQPAILIGETFFTRNNSIDHYIYAQTLYLYSKLIEKNIRNISKKHKQINIFCYEELIMDGLSQINMNEEVIDFALFEYSRNRLTQNAFNKYVKTSFKQLNSDIQNKYRRRIEEIDRQLNTKCIALTKYQ